MRGSGWPASHLVGVENDVARGVAHRVEEAAAAMCVFTSAWAARPSPLSAEPALNPNQPNHRMPAPMSVNGSACGGIG